jgi:hypothetical protein
MWHRAYEKLSAENPGLFGAVTSRGEAQVIRLALLYAMLDKSTHICSEHLTAALAFWQYCEDSARFIFDGETEEQRAIIEYLKETGEQSKSGISRGLFSKNRRAELLTADLEALSRRRKIGRRKNDKGTHLYRALLD